MAIVKLGEVARESKLSYKGDKSTMKIVGLEHLTPESVTLTEWSENTENTFTKKFLKWQILFGRRRAYLKKAAVAPFDGICSGDITVIEAIPGKINDQLLPFIIQNERFFDYAVEKSAGSLSPRVKWEHLKDYEFELPDMAEQERLAKILWAAEDLKRKINSVKKCLINLRISYRKEVMFDDIKSIDESLSEKYNFFDLESCCRILDTKRKPLNDAERSTMKGDIPYYGAVGIVDYINESIFNEPIILVSEDCGFFEEYAEKPIAFYVDNPCWVNNHAHVIVSNDEKCSNDWLYYSLVHKNISYLVTGGTRSKLNQEQLKKIIIPVPKNDKITNEILNNLRAMDKYEAQLFDCYNDLALLEKTLTNNISGDRNV